jgi:hypothetical protein
MSKDQEWIDAMRARGHTPCLDDDGDLDRFAMDRDHHNGPGCDTCHTSWCWHCDTPDEIDECTNPALELIATEIRGELPAPKRPE